MPSSCLAFFLGNAALLPAGLSKCGVSTRRSSGNSTADVVTHNGTVLNIPNLLHSLQKGETKCQGLEQCVASLQAKLSNATHLFTAVI